MNDSLDNIRFEREAGTGDSPGGTCREGFCRKTIRLERELTRWKREEAVLRDMERRYLALSDNPLFILLVLSGDRVLFMNRRGEEFFGFSFRERPRFRMMDYIAPGFVASVEQLLARSSDHETPGGRLTFSVRSEDGRERWIDFSAAPGVYHGESVLLGVGYELPGAPVEAAADISSPERFSADAAALPQKDQDLVRLLLAEREDLLMCAMDMECVPSFMTDGFRRVATSLWGRLPEKGESFLDLIPADATGDAFRLAVGRARAGEAVEIGREAGDSYFSLSFSPVYNREGEVLGLSLLLLDRTGYRRLERERRAEAERFRKLFEASSDMMLITSLDEGRVLLCNRALLSRLGYSEIAVLGRTVEDLHLYHGAGQRERLMNELGANGPVNGYEVKLNTATGGAFFGKVSSEKIEMDGRACIFSVFRDITGEKQVEERKRKATDPLSGIPNREGFERILGTETERAMRYRGNMSLILIDLDGFGALNETLGRETGDKVLKDFCAAVKSRIRPTDFMGRWGADEVAVLTPMSGPLAYQVAEAIRDMIFHYKFLPDRTLSSSMGVAEFRREMEMSEFVKRAEYALLEAKKAGGNRTVLAPFVP
jgi:diguanylate cyclase (GGDEF)-like protein/PAS domain S-box-containing protein